MIDEAAWRAYVLAYDVEVSQERIAEELSLIRADLKHRMQYEQMSGGKPHLFPDAELDAQNDTLYEAACFEAKERLVLNDLAEKLTIEVTQEELDARAQEIAEREGSSLEMLKRFFGEGFELLERGVREDKIRAWACSQ